MRKIDNKILSASTRIIAAKILNKSDEVHFNASLMHTALMDAADRIEELDMAICETIKDNLDLCDGKEYQPTSLMDVIATLNTLNKAYLELVDATRYRSVDEELPKDGQDVIFIADAGETHDYMNGRILGGKFMAGKHPAFTIPGMHVWATQWMPSPRLNEDQEY